MPQETTAPAAERAAADAFMDFLRREAAKTPARSAFGRTAPVRYVIYAKRAAAGQHIYCVKENAHYDAVPGREIVLSGADGEQYMPKSNADFWARYEIAGPETATGWVPVARKGGEVCVMQIPLPIQLKVTPSWGGGAPTMTANLPDRDGGMDRHGGGDYFVCEPDRATGRPDLATGRIVEYRVFLRTYDMGRLGRPGLQAPPVAAPVPAGFVTGVEAQGRPMIQPTAFDGNAVDRLRGTMPG